MKQLTAAQQDGLYRLRALLLGPGQIPCDQHGNIRTGVNLRVLDALRQAGFLSCSHIYAGGKVSPDIKLAPAHTIALCELT